jgi:hypothetical protein
MEVDPFWLARIESLLPLVRDRLDPPSPVKAIYIHRTTDAPPDGEWNVPGITRYHTGAGPLLQDLVRRGLVPRSAFNEVADSD